MGEIISKLGRTEFKDNTCGYLDMEINIGNVVHLQTNSWRIELTLNEFVNFAQSVVTSADKLKANKGL